MLGELQQQLLGDKGFCPSAAVCGHSGRNGRRSDPVNLNGLPSDFLHVVVVRRVCGDKAMSWISP